VYDLNRLTDTRTWLIAEAGTISGFSADKFELDVSGFSNYVAGDPNTFAITRIGQKIYLSYAPVPEPTTVLGFAAAALGAVAYRRRRAG
jgi:hypothetical protein